MTTARPPIRVWDDTVAPLYTLCRGCQARIWWARTCANNKPICFDSFPVAVKTEQVKVEVEWPRPDTRTIRFVDGDRVHWGKCPASDQLRKARA